MLSHQLEQNHIDGEKTIIQARNFNSFNSIMSINSLWPGVTHRIVIQNPSEAQRKEHDKFDFELHEVFAVDVLISTGEGQVRNQRKKIVPSSEKSTILISIAGQGARRQGYRLQEDGGNVHAQNEKLSRVFQPGELIGH